MIHSELLMVPKYDQLISSNKLSLIENAIKRDIERSNKMTDVGFRLTTAEEQYLLLYGYRTIPITGKTLIFWEGN